MTPGAQERTVAREPIGVLLVEDDDGDAGLVEDALRCYEMHANAYITKPVDFDRFGEIVHQIDDFFTGIVRLRPKAR